MRLHKRNYRLRPRFFCAEMRRVAIKKVVIFEVK